PRDGTRGLRPRHGRRHPGRPGQDDGAPADVHDGRGGRLPHVVPTVIRSSAWRSSPITASGRGAYCRPGASFWPSASIQARNSFIARPFSASAIRVGTRSQVKLAIGYASAAAASVIETRKSDGMLLAALAAAAVMLSRLACTKRPPRFFTAPTGSLFCTAYTSST